jgi:predicted ferric reductase
MTGRMMAGQGHAFSRRLIAPFGALALSLAGVWWAFPEDLPLWRSIAIVTAWAGSGLLVASVALMVREPRFASLLGGLDAMYRWHHRCGSLAYALLLCHPIALALAGWSESPRTAWQALAPWTQGWPGWLGWASLMFLMIGLATTFSLRLSYRRWRAFHYLLPVGVVGGLVHIYVLLGEGWLVYALTALALAALGWRLIVTDFGLSAHPYLVTKVMPRAARMIEAWLAPSGTRLRVSPGQFVLAAFADGPRYRGCGEFHPFTVSGIGAQGELAVSVKALGPCSRHIQELEPGVLVRLQGPFGTFLEGEPTAPQLWIAGGVGITPFVAALRRGAVAHPTALIYLYRTPNDAAFLDELGGLAAAHPELQLLSEATGDGLPDLEGLLSRVSGLAAREVRLCGPAVMVETAKALLRRRGVRPESIHFESFDFR